ncbi:hypothetical protein [Halobacillus salinus]|uniref:Uncharacterized protein n=1 Tax=Halobacillus salinus TaxID=192814 RepID=A0A4Z0GTB9_9BACI|nr:hypothetical protein [Halobacillus salinus]TGB00751.1 hypothetical protein E4663_19235 [Halobacillus salinus]
MRKYWKRHVAVGAIVLLLSFLVLRMLDVPAPFGAGVFLAFFAFEISVYHSAAQERKKRMLD